MPSRYVFVSDSQSAGEREIFDSLPNLYPSFVMYHLKPLIAWDLGA